MSFFLAVYVKHRLYIIIHYKNWHLYRNLKMLALWNNREIEILKINLTIYGLILIAVIGSVGSGDR